MGYRSLGRTGVQVSKHGDHVLQPTLRRRVRDDG
jgi:hypothetical protein